LLELSGIGSRKFLEPLGIPVAVDLPGVGENVQEHCFTNVIFELRPGLESLDALDDAAYAAEQMKLHPEGKGLYQLTPTSIIFTPLKTCTGSSQAANEMITTLRQRMSIRANALSPGLKEQYDIQLEKFEAGTYGDCEIGCFPQFYRASGTPEPGRNYVTLVGLLNRPLSRGTIHIASRNPHDQAEMDPHYFEDSFDLEVMRHILRFMRRLGTSTPFSTVLGSEVLPGPNCTSDDSEDAENYIKDTLSTTFHTVGSASMLPRNKNGVVDANLRVYGTTNIRVVDLSVVPLHVSAHTQVTAYAIAEQAADIIKGIPGEEKYPKL